MKDEGGPPDPRFATLLFDKYLDKNYTDLFTLGNTTPTLDSIRGKIQLLRRFVSPRNIGINVTEWEDNKPYFNFTTPAGVQFTIQDEYAFPAIILENVIARKIEISKELLGAANKEPSSDHWYMNFASASSWKTIIGTPSNIAEDVVMITGVNDRLNLWLRTQNLIARWGIVVFDYPEYPADLITRIVTSNTFLPDAATNEENADVQAKGEILSTGLMQQYVTIMDRFTERVERAAGLMEKYLKHFD